MTQKLQIQAFILAGGKSSRMGSEKGLMQLSGKPFVTHLINTLKIITPNICILANNNIYKQFGLPVIEDIVKLRGPLGGIHAALTYSEMPINLFVSCDIPRVSAELLQFLISRYHNTKALVVSHHGITEPLCGIYSANCLPPIKKLIDNNELSVHGALNILNADILEISNESFYKKNLLQNINTPDELKKAEEELSCKK